MNLNTDDTTIGVTNNKVTGKYKATAPLSMSSSAQMSILTDSNRLKTDNNKLSKIDDTFTAEYGAKVETVVGTGGKATTVTMSG